MSWRADVNTGTKLAAFRRTKLLAPLSRSASSSLPSPSLSTAVLPGWASSPPSLQRPFSRDRLEGNGRVTN